MLKRISFQLRFSKSFGNVLKGNHNAQQVILIYL